MVFFLKNRGTKDNWLQHHGINPDSLVLGNLPIGSEHVQRIGTKALFYIPNDGQPAVRFYNDENISVLASFIACETFAVGDEAGRVLFLRYRDH